MTSGLNYFLGPEDCYSLLENVLSYYSIFAQTRRVKPKKLHLMFASCANNLEFRNVPGSEMGFCQREPSIVFI